MSDFGSLTFQEWMFVIPIAALYPFFCDKGVDVFFEYKKLRDERSDCWDIDHKSPKYSKCNDNIDAKIDKVDMYRYLVLLSLGIGVLISAHYIKQKPIQYGLLLGGLMTIFWATAGYWNKMGEKLKFGATGTGLGILIYAAWKFFK